MIDEKRFAVLIDADNVSAKYIKYILDEISNYGVATYKRIYGDWTKPTSASWKDVLLENSVTPVQQYSYTIGKNSTDAAMIIDAMDILYSGNVEGFCIVSSDSDFTRLSARLRESGMLVVGMGERKTPKPFIAACNQFKYLDVLAEAEKTTIDLARSQSNANLTKVKAAEIVLIDDAEPSTKVQKSIVNSESTISDHDTQNNNDVGKNMTDLSIIKSTIIKMMNEVDAEDQSMHMGELGNRLVKRYPDFDVRNYGDTKLSKFLKKLDFLEINSRGKDSTSMWVSLKKEDNNSQPIKHATPKKNRRRYKSRQTQRKG